MPFEILRQDITKMNVDAIVNSTGSYPGVGGGADFKINESAGPELLAERQSFGFLKTTEAVLTKGYQLNAKHVIHVVGPVYVDGTQNEEELLYKTYENALKLASQTDIESIAFPLISSGTFGFPRGKALEIALNAIKSFLDISNMMIYLVVYDERTYQLSLDRFISIKSYIETNQIEKSYLNRRIYSANYLKSDESPQLKKLEDIMDRLDDTFAESLFHLIDERGLDDISVYKKANIDRRLFSKIKSNLDYQPSKLTAVAFAIALELSLDETKDLLAKAGYALSESSKFDLIIQYFIENENYDLYEINQVLFTFNQKLLGGQD
jgi:O-acetyl-ADP-ribose deacetylase (regulator of RNase III)